MALGNLKVTLTLAADQFVSGIKTVEKELSGLEKTLSSPSIAAEKIGKGMIAAGAAIGGALLGAAHSAANYGDAMFELSQKTGISGASLAGYKLLADQSGSSIEGLATGMKILSKNMLAAASDSKGVQAQLFNALGISVKDASGNMRDLDEIIPQISEKFKGMEDGALKSALATKLMGRSGESLIPFFNEGAGAIAEATAKMEHYGAATTKAEEAMSDKFNDALAESSLAMQGLSNSIGFALIPDLTELIEKGNEWIAVASQWVKANPEIVEGFAGLSAVLIGGGGVLVGITGIGAALPAFKVGLAAIGGAAVLAQVGLIGLAAGVGFLIGRFLDAQIEAAGFQKEVDSFILKAVQNSPLSFLAPDTSGSGGDPVAAARVKAANEAEARRRGISVGQLSAESVSLGMAAHARNANKPPQVPPVTSGDAELRKLMADLEKKNKAAEVDRFNESVKGLMASLTDTVPPSKELVDAIHKLDAAGKMSSSVILALGKDIDTLKNSNDPLIQQYVKMIPLIQMAAESLKFEAEMAKLVDETTKSRTFDPLLLPLDLENMGGPSGVPLPEGDIRGGMISKRAKDAQDSLEDQRQEMRDLSDTITELSRQNMSATEIENALGISMDGVAERARELDVAIDPMISKMARQGELSKSWGDSMEGLSRGASALVVDSIFERTQKLKNNKGELNRLAEAFGIDKRGVKESLDDYYERIKEASKATEEFKEMFKEANAGESFFKKLGELAKSTSKDMLHSMLDGFLTPFHEGMKGIGKAAGDWAGGLIFGTKKTADKEESEGLLGGLLPKGGLGGLMDRLPWGKGKDGAPGPGDWERMPIPGQGGGGGMGGGQQGGAMGTFGSIMAMNPAGMAQSIWATGKDIAGTIGNDKRAQSAIVGLQNAFEKSIKSVSYDQGLTTTDRLKIINQMWADFQEQAFNFAGGDQVRLKAVNGAIGTLMPFVTDQIRDLTPWAQKEAEAARLAQGGTVGGGNVVNGDVNVSFVLPEGITPEGWLDWLYKNKAGIGTAITENVLAMQGAIVAR